MLRAIRITRVTRDLVMFAVPLALSIVWIIVPTPAYQHSDPIAWFGIPIAVGFGIGALVHWKADKAWDRAWFPFTRCWSSLIGLAAGILLLGYSVALSGATGLHGTGTTHQCDYVQSSKHAAYVCNVSVQWNDGTSTRESLSQPESINDGTTLDYVWSKQLPAPWNQATPVSAWTDVWFYYSMAAAIIVHALWGFVLGVIGLIRRRRVST